LDKVVEGFVNDIKLEFGELRQDEVDEIIKRRLICETCPLNSKIATEQGWYVTQRDDFHCTCCGCPISRKTASLMSSCGADYHNLTKPEEPQLQVKWIAYDKNQNQ
jgi:hypothetical protein